ncbi:hypothetical protein ACR9YC_09430 [Parasphingorhabdus sp. DH2-15]|uniref:hypothetical protein n=1 Tax=Parasphingorhabdus sp. DH2-15 TaxID=3444112 RepID=UPI003F68493D
MTKHIFSTSGLRLALVIAIFTLAVPAAMAKDSLGLFESWAAFRDPDVPRCYAIAKPEEISGPDRNRAYASIGYWPKKQLYGQFHIHLSRDMIKNADITLRVGRRRFTLTGKGEDAWSQNRKMDAAIVAALRQSRTMTVTARSAGGGRIIDKYTLPGVATAMDAAALACARL